MRGRATDEERQRREVAQDALARIRAMLEDAPKQDRLNESFLNFASLQASLVRHGWEVVK